MRISVHMNYSAMENMQHNFILSETYSHMHWSLHVSHLIHQVCIRGETALTSVFLFTPCYVLKILDSGVETTAKTKLL